MTSRFAKLVLTAVFAASVALAIFAQAGVPPIPCCVVASHATDVTHAPCPPVGPARSCCPDCPLLLTALVPTDRDPALAIHLPLVATFPTRSFRAIRRSEAPPHPPPRAC